MIELTIALIIGTLTCFALFLLQAWHENKELERMKKEVERLEEIQEALWMNGS